MKTVDLLGVDGEKTESNYHVTLLFDEETIHVHLGKNQLLFIL